jgi:predicted small lipoprotein YifL
MKAKFLITCLSIIILGLSLSACGKRGGPFAPEDAENTYPRQYPKPEAK